MVVVVTVAVMVIVGVIVTGIVIVAVREAVVVIAGVTEVVIVTVGVIEAVVVVAVATVVVAAVVVKGIRTLFRLLHSSREASAVSLMPLFLRLRPGAGSAWLRDIKRARE